VVHKKNVVQKCNQRIVNRYHQPIIRELNTRVIEQQVVHQKHRDDITHEEKTATTEIHEDPTIHMEDKNDVITTQKVDS